MTAEPDLAKAELNNVAASNRELEVSAATCNRELSVVVQTVRSLKGLVAPGKDRPNTVRALACETVKKMSELRSLVGGLNLTFGGERACASALFREVIIRVWSVITAALLEIESTSMRQYPTCLRGFAVWAALCALGSSERCWSDMA